MGIYDVNKPPTPQFKPATARERPVSVQTPSFPSHRPLPSPHIASYEDLDDLPSYDDSVIDITVQITPGEMDLDNLDDLPTYEDSVVDETISPPAVTPSGVVLSLGPPNIPPPRPPGFPTVKEHSIRPSLDKLGWRTESVPVISSLKGQKDKVEPELEQDEILRRLETLRNVSTELPPPPSAPQDSEEEEEEEEFDPPPYGCESEEDEEDAEDEALILALMEAELEEEAAGADNLEECKIVVQWGEAGDAPPVPSRDDPSHKLSDQQAEQFIKQKEDIPGAYSEVMGDPRLQRLRLKWCPNVFSKDGAVQFLKNKVAPSTIPYVGFLFHVHHIKEAVDGRSQLEKIAKTAGPELSTSMDTFKGAQVTRCIQETAYTGVAAACMMLPVVDIVPGLSAQLMILGEVGAGVAETGIEMGLKVIISKTSAQLTAAAMEKTEAFSGFGSSKAFLLYLGYPKTDDPLYAQWEPHRLKLKALYGCAPEDDLSKMKPKGELLKQIKKEERRTGKPYQIELPLLVLLYRAFDCWQDLYYDQIIGFKDGAKGKTKQILGLRRDLTLEERRRMRDYRKLQQTATVIESKNALDPHLQILKKNRKREIVAVLTKSLLHSYHVAYLFSRKKPRTEQKDNLKWFMKMVVDYFFAHNAFFWGYVGTDNEIKAVAIWERPCENAQISFLSMIRTSGAVKLGPNRWKKMSDILFKMENIRKKDIRGLRCWMLHWIGVLPRYHKKGIGRLLIENTIRRHDEPVYVQLFDIEEEMVLFMKKRCFVPVRHVDAKFQLYGKNVTVIAYWFGIQSPSELRALLPVKKKNPLQLTYNTIKKAASYQTLPKRGTSSRKALANVRQQMLLDSQESKLLREAKDRFEETSTLLDHLKIDLASLPTDNRDVDPLAISLQEKINEYQHLVDIYRASLEDAQNNVNSLQPL